MARHSTVRQRAPGADEDTFVSGVLEATDWTRRHGRTILTALIALVVVIAAVLYYRNYRQALEARATNELMNVRQIAASGNMPLATRELTQFVAKYNGTHAGSEGRLLLAQTLLEEGNAKGAIPVIQPLANDLKDPLGPSAALLLGAAYEATNDIPRAVATYQRVGENAPLLFQKREALEDAARLKLQHNDPAGAAALYQQILAQIPDTATGRSIYQMRLAQAQAEAESRGGARK